MARTEKQTGRVEVCRSTQRSELDFMQKRLAYLGCRDVRVERGTTRAPGKLLRAFVLTVPAKEYEAVFPALDRKAGRLVEDSEDE